MLKAEVPVKETPLFFLKKRGFFCYFIRLIQKSSRSALL